MSMNKYMHPRNIYKTPPNFKQLAIDFPEFRKYVKQDISGKITLDFKDIDSLRALSCVLLKKDFGLDVNIPHSKLIPTIPLRLNYLLWIEDLLSIANRTEKIRGIDIGTGASCVYPLIATKKFQWYMLASETNEESCNTALDNVRRNKLETLVKVINVSGDNTLLDVCNSAKDDFDFCMCNPPFFSSTQELHPFFKSRKSNRPHPRNAFCASQNEVVVNGGEVEFISKIINESKTLQNRVKIYTTMVGHKSSLTPLKHLLREIDVISFKQTEFCQGHTTRWGLAWTFDHIDLRKIPPLICKQKHMPPLTYTVPKVYQALQEVLRDLFNIFDNLKFIVEEIKSSKTAHLYIITAHSNTWSHQRRKRRELQRELNKSGSSNSSCETVDLPKELNCTSTKLANMDLDETKTNKRPMDDDGFFNNKKIKTIEDNNDRVFLKASCFIKCDKEDIILELACTEGNSNRDGLHQVLQYIKNNLKP